MIKRMVGWLFRTARIPRLLQIAAVLTLLALAMMLWARRSASRGNSA